MAQSGFSGDEYGPSRLSVELTDICNLHCSYCLRDDEALYRRTPNYFSLDLLKRVIAEAREAIAATHVSFTGGEPTLHPNFAEILEFTTTAGVKASFVTNGWNFEKIWPALLQARDGISHVAFSVDGVTAKDHDAWRGAGSFVRLVKAFSRCSHAGMPFSIKVGIRRDTIEQFEQIALFAARVGAATLSFGHILPTSLEVSDQSGLTLEERRSAEQEIAMLARIFKMSIGIDVGYYNIILNAPCAPLAGRSCNIDYRGRLTLCCNLSGFRGAADELDVAADLNNEPFRVAYERLRSIARGQLQKRAEAIAAFEAAGKSPDLETGSPCLFCLHTFGKVPWQQSGRSEQHGDRSLPVMKSTLAAI